MVKIFISYARKDAGEIAEELADSLRALNHEVFLDIHGIPGGTEWEKQLIQRAKWCDALVLLITPASNQSKYVYHEFREAEKNKKLIIPVQVDDAPLLPHLSHLNVIKFENNNFDGLLLKLELAFRHLTPKSKNNWVTIIGTILVLGLVIAATAFYLANNPPQVTSSETPTDTESPISPTPATPSRTPSTEASPTESPTATVNTPRPSNTPSPVTNTPTVFNPILLNENFEDGVAQGWTVEEGNWLAIPDGTNIVFHRTDSQDRYAGIVVGESEWQNYRLEFDIKSVNLEADGRVFVHVFVNARGNKIILVLDFEANTLQLFEVYENATSELTTSTSYNFIENEWIRVRIELVNGVIAVYLDDGRRITRRLGNYSNPRGQVTFRSPSPDIYFDNVIISLPEE